MATPPINWILLLFEHIKGLALPLEIYQAAKTLNQIVAFDFKFDTTRSRRKAISLPEAQLMSLIIVAVKLLFPFDSDTIERYPRSLNEPGAQQLDWISWVEAQKRFDNSGKDNELQRGQEVEVKDSDIFKMSETQLDQYMDWYQRTWAKTEIAGENVNRNILDMFPLKTLPDQNDRADIESDREAAVQSKLHEVQSSMKLRRPISDEEAEKEQLNIMRPGSHYAIFRSVNDLSIQPVAKAFYGAAAEMACLSLETMVRAVVQTERRIALWRNAKRRAERFGEEMDLNAEGGIVSGLDELGLSGGLIGEGSEALEEDAEESGSNMEMI
jgi:RNA polymerase I-specific transcription initiation factor RRN7